MITWSSKSRRQLPTQRSAHRSATDCERPFELARFPCPSLPKPPRLQTLHRGRVGPCFSQLLFNPKCIGISRHIEMQDLRPVVADDEKAVQNTKRERWDGEEIHCRNGLTMVSEERQPSLHGIWNSRSSPDASRDTPFRELETQLEKFAVNARCSPGRILGNHTENQGAHLFADTLPSPYLADTGDPRPIQTKPRAMPVHDGSRSDQDERLGPPGPERSQRNPEQLVQGSGID